MLEDSKLAGILPKKSPQSLDSGITNKILTTNINNNIIQSLNNSLALTQLHPKNKSIKSIHNSINNGNIFQILSKLIDNISKIIFCTVYLH